ncbi:cytochrome P450 [Thozetella sp. PMI_491]|nr:cytochrome P450 [Thozetella sp. PMI_491]
MSCPFHAAPKAESDASAAAVAHPNGRAEVPDGEPIPHPPESWLTGNLGEIDPAFAVLNRKIVFISSYELANEVLDDMYYEKKVVGVQKNVRALTKNGLFTAYNDEEVGVRPYANPTVPKMRLTGRALQEWGIAHRTLVPAFGPIHIRSMFPKMVDVLSQMVLRWDRFGPDQRISCTGDFTRLAFEVIGLCAFSHRFNAFYSDKLPEFAEYMVDTLIEVGKQSHRMELENWLRFRSRQKLDREIHAMWDICDKLVAERRAHPRPDVDDIINTMLTAKDPVTGKGFTDENIRYQMVTFMVAGHETTAGTMNFMYYYLLQYPDKLQKCYAEVDAVLGDKQIELSDVPKFKYIEATIRETLRYFGPISVLTRGPKEPILLAGKYKMTPDVPIIVNLKGVHRDPAVWGDDADEFKPERFLDGGWDRVPQHAWRPFGNGLRQCIGRYLAEQEIIIAMAMVLQRFIVEQADPDYELKIKSTLTVKPDEFYIKVRRRPGKDHLFDFTGSAPPPKADVSGAKVHVSGVSKPGLKPLAVFYGGNTGTCKSFGEDIQTNAPGYGFAVDAVKSLDEAVEAIPRDRPVVLITSSYEGLPPDNARGFVAWLEARVAGGTSNKLLSGVTYTVFGLGNRDWPATFHHIPKLVDRLMEQLGATRFLRAGFVDVGQDISGPFEDWKVELFPKLRELGGVTSNVQVEEIKVEISQPDAPSKLAGEEVSEGLVLANNVLVKNGLGPEKRHMDVLLPPGVEYRSGMFNHRSSVTSVTRVLNRFGLHPDDVLTISGTSKEHLKGPAGGTISVFELVSSRVELANPTSQRQVATLAKLAEGTDATRLTGLATDELYEKGILEKRFSIIDLLEDFPSISLSFGAYLDMLAPLAPRQYSISSSPLARLALPAASTTFMPASKSAGGGDDDAFGTGSSLTASVTYDVYSAPSYSNPARTFSGVASSYLADLLPGSRIRCFVRSTAAPFRLPLDPKTPVIFVAAGTGVAPMRAFIQDRAAIASARPGGAAANLGPAILYYGFRDSQDYLYRQELEQAEKDGVVTVRPAVSRPTDTDGHRPCHVDELIWDDREQLRGLFMNGGARILVCGSAARLGRSTQEVCIKVYREAHPEATAEEAQAWLQKQKEDRYISDVFG